MLRAKVNQLINRTLDTHKYFNFNDFEISTPSKTHYSAQLLIRYEYDQQYYIEINIPNEKSSFTKPETNFNGKTTHVEYLNYKIDGKMSPGQLSISEAFKYEGENSIAKAINLWLNNLWEELTITPEIRVFNAQKEEIEKIKSQVENIPDEYFSADEGKELKERLDKLEKQLADKLAAEVPDIKESKEQIDKLHHEIETLKQTIPVLKKSGWFKSLITKTMTWLSDPKNQKLLKAGKDLVNTMLPEAKE
jgi:polyhydroxyalkanoate synthesis regulator phasin